MPLSFHGTFDELQLKLKILEGQGRWTEIGSLKQFRYNKGACLNWYETTGTINFQGRPSERTALEKLCRPLLSNEVIEQPEPTPLAPLLSANTEPSIDEPSLNTQSPTQSYFGHRYTDSELVIGLVGAVGTDKSGVAKILSERLRRTYGYDCKIVKISSEIIPEIVKVPSKGQGTEYDRINALMDAGNEARRTTGDNSILALGVVLSISKKRKKDINNSSLPSPRTVFIIDSLKHPEEVTRLREIYSNGFYLLGIHCDTKRRRKHLEKNLHLNASEIDKVIARDEDEHLKHGQRTTDTFHLADFFVRIDGSDDRLQNGLDRLLEILFGNPHITPTFDEYAMFMAFAASLRSADLSRQVGAVIARNQEILSSGANDCPKCTGGLYWPIFDKTASETRDVPGGRDHTRNIDSNKAEQLKIVEEILQSLPMSVDRESVKTALQNSRIMDLTEFGRVVHAEMEALLCCARNGISTRDAEVYGTTFPCHNCAKHIIAAGISRVIYIEPYPKSKAQEFHTDSIQVGFSDTDQLSASLPGEPNKKVWFEAFVGVGPRRFFDLFSVRLGSGYPVKRKDSATGEAVQWAASKECRLRIQMLPRSYLDLELLAAEEFLSVLQRARQ